MWEQYKNTLTENIIVVIAVWFVSNQSIIWSYKSVVCEKFLHTYQHILKLIQFKKHRKFLGIFFSMKKQNWRKRESHWMKIYTLILLFTTLKSKVLRICTILGALKDLFVTAPFHLLLIIFFFYHRTETQTPDLRAKMLYFLNIKYSRPVEYSMFVYVPLIAYNNPQI